MTTPRAAHHHAGAASPSRPIALTEVAAPPPVSSPSRGAAAWAALRRARRDCIRRYGTWAHLVQFLAVGLSGTVVNVALLTLLLEWGMPGRVSVAVAIALSMLWNFALNRRFSFSYARGEPIARQLIGFVAACSLGAVVNYGVTVALWSAFARPQVPAALGILAGTGFNFVTSRFLVFRGAPRAVR